MENYELTTITSRGQVTIPQSFREKEKIEAGDKLIVRDVDGYIVMRKVSKEMLKGFFDTMEKVGKHMGMKDVRALRKEAEKNFVRKTSDK